MYSELPETHLNTRFYVFCRALVGTTDLDSGAVLGLRKAQVAAGCLLMRDGPRLSDASKVSVPGASLLGDHQACAAEDSAAWTCVSMGPARRAQDYSS